MRDNRGELALIESRGNPVGDNTFQYENCNRHDLDFGAILAATKADSPSVLQLRTQDIFPRRIGESVVSAFKQFEDLLSQGALVSIDQKRARARILPFSSQL
jgi:hypothetical protein